VRVDQHVSLLEKSVLTLFTPFQEFADQIADFITGKLDSRRETRNMKEELKRMREKVQSHDRIVFQLREQMRENARLRELLGLKPAPGWNMELAEVIGRSRRFGDDLLVINKGSRDGIKADLGVICDQGVVGVVWQVAPFSSKLMTLRNPSAVIAAMVEQTGYFDAYSVGTGTLSGKLENYPNFESIQAGQRVLTSGMDSLFPKGLAIGTVSSSSKTRQMFQKVDLVFKVDFSRLEEVMVLLPGPSQELPEGESK